MKRKQTNSQVFSFFSTLTKIKSVILALGFNMTFLVGFYGPPVHKIYLEILPVRNLIKVENHCSKAYSTFKSKCYFRASYFKLYSCACRVKEVFAVQLG